MTRTIKLQVMFHMSHTSIGLQGEILCLLFAARESHVRNDEELFDSRKLLLGEFLTSKGK